MILLPRKIQCKYFSIIADQPTFNRLTLKIKSMSFVFYLKIYFFLLPKNLISLAARTCALPQASQNTKSFTVLHSSPPGTFFCQLSKTLFIIYSLFLLSLSSQAVSLMCSYLLDTSIFYISSLLLF